MERIVRRVDNQLPAKAKALRVCAYARVSNGKDTMLHSLSAQVSHYSEYIQKHPGWIYCGVYTDEAISGTKNTRHSFNDLIEDCRAGKLDMVITKSISRFARNTVTVLQVARELKELGVDIFFEEQSIHTMSADGELVLTILASFAQEEARSNSENQKWRIRKDFAEGKPWCGIMLGYRQEDGQFVIVPEEAEIVKRIFRDYLSGKGIDAIRKGLNEDGITTVYDNEWHHSAIHRILTNYTYTGNLILQKCYSENYLTKKKVTNNGELPKYHVQNAHEAIIDLDTYIEERYHKKVSEIFAEMGEQDFRQMERRMLEEVAECSDVVVACGGGTPCYFDNVALMNSRGLTVYLSVSIERLTERLTRPKAKAKRPLIAQKSDEEIRQFIIDALAKRDPFYSQAALRFDSTDIETAQATVFRARRLKQVLEDKNLI